MAGIIQGSRTQPGRGGVTTFGGLPPFPTVDAIRSTWTDRKAQERAAAAKAQQEGGLFGWEVLPPAAGGGAGGLPPFPGRRRGHGGGGGGFSFAPDDGKRIGYRGSLGPTDMTGANWIKDHGGSLSPDYSSSFGGLAELPPINPNRGQSAPMTLPPFPGPNGPTKWGGDGLFLEARAAGGPVNGGQPYVVGERGPELFLPTQSGVIMPNEALPAWESIMEPGNQARPTAGSLDRVALNPLGQPVGFGSNVNAPAPLPDFGLVERAAMVAAGEQAGQRLLQLPPIPGAAQALPAWPPARAQLDARRPVEPLPLFDPTQLDPWAQRGVNRQAKQAFSTKEGRMAAWQMGMEDKKLNERTQRAEAMKLFADRLMLDREDQRADRIDEREDRRMKAAAGAVAAKEGEAKQEKATERAMELSGQQQRFNNMVQTGLIKPDQAKMLGSITDPKALAAELDRFKEDSRLDRQNGLTKPEIPEPVNIPEGFAPVPTGFNQAGKPTGWKYVQKPKAGNWQMRNMAGPLEEPKFMFFNPETLELKGLGSTAATPQAVKGVEAQPAGKAEAAAEAPRKASSSFMKAVGK